MGLLHQLRQLFSKPADQATTTTNMEADGSTSDELFAHEVCVSLHQQLPKLSAQLHDNQVIVDELSLTVACLVGARNQHPNAVVIGLEVRIFNPNYFPEGILDCLAGIGENNADALAKGAQNHVAGILLTVIEALSASHLPELDFQDSATGLDWHPILGTLQVQGFWAAHKQELAPDHLWQLLQPIPTELLSDQPFHWLKIYVCRMPDGEFISDCIFDNEPWRAGLERLREETAHWETTGQFAGQKQFLLLRQCPPLPVAC